MKRKERISRNIKKFALYIVATDERLQATEPDSGNPYWQVLGLVKAEADEWHNRRLYWSGTLWIQYGSPSTKSSPVNRDVSLFIRNFRTFGNPLLDKIAISPAATSTDELIFNFILRTNRKKPTKKTSRIQNPCFASLLSLGGGDMKISCRNVADTKRASLDLDADSVEIVFRKDNTEEMPATPTPAPGNTDGAIGADGSGALSDPIIGGERMIVTNAKFVLELGALMRGKWLKIAVRWYNTKHPELAGSWSEVYRKLIG